jgi:hypothetical protein
MVSEAWAELDPSVSRRFRGDLFQSAMHPFISSVLLWSPWLNAVVNVSELYPSQRLFRRAQPTDARAWRSVARADTLWHAVLADGGIANGAHLCEIHACDCLASDQKPAPVRKYPL